MSNGLKQLSLAELAEIEGGRVAVAFEQAIRRIAQDCDDRPGDDRARKLVLQIDFAPVMDEQGLCESVKAQMQIHEKLPTRKTRQIDFGLRKNGIMVYQPLSPDDHRQATFPMEESDH